MSVAPAAGEDSGTRPEGEGPGRQDGAGPVVVLVGVPGAGKSTVGRALAERLGVGFRDTDADVESSTGRAIADIFVESGEPEFRRLEARAVSDAVAAHRGVLALGGGAVTAPETRVLLADHSVVWLRVGLAAASQRAGLSVARPVLLGNVRAQLKALMDARAPLYEEVATLVLDTDAMSVDEAVEAILAGLGLLPRPGQADGADPAIDDSGAGGGATRARPADPAGAGDAGSARQDGAVS